MRRKHRFAALLVFDACPKRLLQFGIAQFRVAVGIVIGGRVGWQTEAFTGPGAKIDVLATFAAKGAKGIAGRVNAFAAATGADDDFYRRFGFGHGAWRRKRCNEVPDCRKN
jgi:hypothetical protein